MVNANANKQTAWREHFSVNAADLLQIASALAGFNLQDVLLRCFKRSPKSTRITVLTVEAVLQEISDEHKRIEKELEARLAKFEQEAK